MYTTCSWLHNDQVDLSQVIGESWEGWRNILWCLGLQYMNYSSIFAIYAVSFLLFPNSATPFRYFILIFRFLLDFFSPFRYLCNVQRGTSGWICWPFYQCLNLTHSYSSLSSRMGKFCNARQMKSSVSLTVHSMLPNTSLVAFNLVMLRRS